MDLAPVLAGFLPAGDFRTVFIKPNWVKHQESALFPISALVTDTSLIDSTVRACLETYPGVEDIIVGDIPLQSCDWDLLVGQARIDELIRKYDKWHKPRIRFMDLRRERVRERGGFLAKDSASADGDPAGYREVVLDERSFLEPISGDRERFRVSDYDPQETISNHRQGCHRYVVSGSVLGADLFINLPKMKTHQKAGITGALKNVVGITGQKSCLVHHRLGGDEFAPDTNLFVRAQTRIREYLQKRSRRAFSVARALWKPLRRLSGIEIEGTRDNLDKRMYVGAGSWYGNDTIWRMVYDLNLIVRYAPSAGGALRDTVQRGYVAILDGGTAGEGNGPLQPLPVEAGVVAMANDPFLLDFVMARWMGYDYRKIPMLNHFGLFPDPDWAKFDPATVVIVVDGRVHRGIESLPVLHPFLPSPGWRGHIEKTAVE